MTEKEAAARLGCSVAAIRKWRYQKRLPYVKVGRLVRFRPVDLEQLILASFKAARPSLN